MTRASQQDKCDQRYHINVMSVTHGLYVEVAEEIKQTELGLPICAELVESRQAD